jgi:hypothetical protein
MVQRTRLGCEAGREHAAANYVKPLQRSSRNLSNMKLEIAAAAFNGESADG